MDFLCVVHLFKGKAKPALTMVKGYPVCEKHLSFKTDFFRQWEAVQDPHQHGGNQPSNTGGSN